MSDIQSKFHKGIKSIQRGYEESKEKFQTTQEIINIKDRVSQKEEQRMKLIVSLGEKYYFLYRNGLVEDSEVQKIGAEIQELDKSIFSDLKLIEEKSGNKTQYRKCECGAPLTPEDKFCRSCGKEVEIQEEESTEMIICTNCEAEIPANSKYCNCCGKKLS